MLGAKVPKPLRDWANARFPAAVAAYRDALLTANQLRTVNDRFRSLEQAVHAKAGSAQTVHTWECSVFSQNGEDGILMNLFGRIGADSCLAVEFGCGNGSECNSANLVIGFGWAALLLDADRSNVDKARRFFDRRLGAAMQRVTVEEALVTPENVGELVGRGSSEPDLLSIDIDGNDYWVWSALTDVRPRVVVIEYNASFGREQAVTVAFDAEFDRYARHPSGYYHGASLEALRRLGARQGYRLVGCDSAGVNAFFVRDDIAGDLPRLTSAEAFVPMRERAHVTEVEQFDLIRHLPLVEAQ